MVTTGTDVAIATSAACVSATTSATNVDLTSDNMSNEGQGRIQDFLKGGSESVVDIEDGANPSIVSLKQGVWGAQPPRSYGVFNFG